MKLPTLFIPERDTDRKIEELKQNPEPKKPKRVTIEELLENDMEILYGDSSDRKRMKIYDNTFNKIVKDTFAGKIEWKKEPKNTYTAEITIKNYERQKITIPISFRALDARQRYKNDIWGFLYLGNEEGTCRNTWNEDVERLATEYFKLKEKKRPRKRY
ncbi:MAG: hypothetical protein Q8N77_05440 [Nanoarchaeota archaeon]|nr:hypothetical protein [Nanoarchaeota archaeon]